MNEAIVILNALADPSYDADPRKSICSYLGKRIPMPKLHELFRKWPEFSGNYAYPIHTYRRGTPPEQWGLAYERGLMWSGEYGAARRRLAAFMLEQLKC